MIIFGTGFYGKIEDYNNHRIETKFFHIFFIPLFPTSSMYVTSSSFRKRTGWELALNTKSITAAYARVFSLLFAGGLLFLAFNSGPESAMKIWLMALAMAGCCVYLHLFYGRSTDEEIGIRNKIKSCTGMYALPHWFNFIQAENQFRFFSAFYQEKYPDRDWKADVRNSHPDSEKQKLLYAIALFNCMTYDTPENEELYYKADNLYQLSAQETSAIEDRF